MKWVFNWPRDFKTRLCALEHLLLSKLYRALGIEVMPVMWLSTGHITYITSQRFHHIATYDGAAHIGGAMVYSMAYGWMVKFVDIPSPEDDGPEKYPDLAQIAAFAKARGIEWVRFDQDGSEVPELPTYDW